VATRWPRHSRGQAAIGCRPRAGPEAGVLVGRDTELAVLDSLVSRTTAGMGGIVLLTGEPG
jgi:hypothetical protein